MNINPKQDYITNIPAEWIATSQIRKIYQIPWQIEFGLQSMEELL
jgi:hypothetical protein